MLTFTGPMKNTSNGKYGILIGLSPIEITDVVTVLINDHQKLSEYQSLALERATTYYDGGNVMDQINDIL